MLSFTACGILLMSILSCAWTGAAWIASASPTAVESVEAASTYRFIVNPPHIGGPGSGTVKGNSARGDQRLRAVRNLVCATGHDRCARIPAISSRRRSRGPALRLLNETAQ